MRIENVNDTFDRCVAPTIVIASNDAMMQSALCSYLEENGLIVFKVDNQEDFSRYMSGGQPHVIILDRYVGNYDGFDILRGIRSKSSVPVILMTDPGCDEIDHVLGLELGADDYIGKPLDLRYLLAQIRVAIRRRPIINQIAVKAKRYIFDGWIFDGDNSKLRSPAGKSTTLTAHQRSLLHAFVSAPRRQLSRQYLLNSMKPYDMSAERNVDVCIMQIRRKLMDGFRKSPFVVTERGKGYRFDADVDVV